MTGDHVAETMGTSVKMLNSHYKHGTIEQTRRYLMENGLITTGRKLVPREEWEPLEVTILEDLPPGDWRRKKLVIAPE
jgi:hypothetical protein